ncbi:zinc finger protein, putative [Pediculus humanus corporis]|uniref:Zinc finger protein, putative n=1 Tax=Pediculus humanus subsp. corporis TaxID=121224 RepID=E0VMU7_PEDHC|nr:zinc finger protein, putative [Pediculus humanus corporis]EEB14703.1 zinc finger protein, putative [Pediculus humanus corporis]
MAEVEKNSHKCVLCNSKLESKEALQLHFRKHANGEIDSNVQSKSKITSRKSTKKDITEVKKEKTKAIACDVCGQEFTNNTNAIQHKFKKHPDASVKYVCSYCGMQFTIKAIFENHIKRSHITDIRQKKSLYCEECGAEFYFQEAKEYHYKSTHKSVYYCHLCGCEYMIKFNLQKHLEKAHNEDERSILPSDLIRCTTCDALFYNQKAYEIHNITHKPDDLYVTSEQQRLQTVSRVDQDFDIRRVLPFAQKYLPTFKQKPKINIKTESENQVKVKEEELSPPSTPESTDSDSEGDDVPLSKLKKKTLFK